MAGGAVIAQSTSSRPQPAELPKTTFYVVLLTCLACVGGLLFGYDTGVVSSAMLFLPDNEGMKGLNTVWQELIISITPGMAGIGALCAGKTSDMFGRRVTILFASFVFAIGAVVCAIAPEKWTLFFGRVLLGIAVGFASMIIPVFIGEGAPSHMRGTLVTIYQFMIAAGFIVANGVAAGFAQIDPERVGWRLMFGFAAIPAIIQFVGFIFLPDTPRYLFRKEREAEGEAVLEKIYGGDKAWIAYEIAEIKGAIEAEAEAHKEFEGTLVVARVFRTPHVRKALLIGSSLQMFQQLIGINTLLYYTGKIIQSAGVEDKTSTILISCAISAVQAVATFIPMKLIEKFGRRMITLISMIGVFISLCLMGISFLLINKDSVNLDQSYLPGLPENRSSYESFAKCHSFSNCDFCVTAPHCGFCHVKGENKIGQCLPTNMEKSDYSTLGFCQKDASNSSDYKFTHYCSTKFTILPIVVMVIYLVCFAFGMGPIPWVYNAEIYPLWARSTCVSITTFTNWIFNLLIALTFLSLGEAITKYGSFFLYASFTAVGFVIFYIFMPETKGLQMEQIENLFKSTEERRKTQISGYQMKVLEEKL
ncbi:unnamed protein product, partial [Mesorhabditis belari]|uniref:Major facilitator superfamily (MFS) profile domain-containing protein n=1 Tax=Mesorhabditis belari TaxID=2138241 RepID=A0AAF3FP18_9BILA